MPRLIISAIFLVTTQIWGIRGLDCDFGWFRYKNKCYLIHGKKGTFDEAETTCRTEHNGVMVSIHSSDEQNFVTHLMFKTCNSPGHIWIGGRRRGPINTDTYQWDDGTPFNYTQWYPGYPNSTQGNDTCVVMWSAPENLGKWFHWSCDTLHIVLCQRTLDMKEGQLGDRGEIPSQMHFSVRLDLNPLVIGLCFVCIVIMGIMCCVSKRNQRVTGDKVGLWASRSHSTGQPIELNDHSLPY